MKKRILCMLLALVLLVPVLLQAAPVAQAAGKDTPKRAIGIVFDNSGSMYGEQWCHATYAMEVFAAMMNEGDSLRIFPMHKITVNGTAYERGTNKNCLTINGPKESSVIRNILTEWAGKTPVESVQDAYETMKGVSADEKYLIVLTDGNEFNKGDKDLSPSETKSLLTEELAKCAQDMNVMYLGIGVKEGNKPQEKNPAKQYHLTTSYADTPKNLSAMCNRIFGRNTLPGSNIQGNKVTFDVSMSKLILFVQGTDISGVKINGGTKVSEQSVRYSELGAENKKAQQKVDKSLQGMMVTYENLDAGTYELSFNGSASSINVYYEPDVDLKVRFVDENGMEVDPAKDDLYAGTYKLTYEMVDKNGKSTNSKLLGSVEYEVVYTINGKASSPHKTTGSGSVPVEVKAGDELDANFVVRYLDGYTIYKDSTDLGWPAGGLQIDTRPAGDLQLQLSPDGRRFQLSTFEQEAVFKLTAFYEGSPVKGEQMANLSDPEISLEGGNAQWEVTRDEDGFTIKLKYNGDAASTTTGEQNQTLKASLVYTNEDNQTNTQTKSASFQLIDDTKALGIEINLEQDYYVTSKLDKSAPIALVLTSEGKPLTEETFKLVDEVILYIDGEQVPADRLEKDAVNSRYLYRLSKEDNLSDGEHTLKAVVNGKDTLGRPCSDQAEATIKTDPLPKWVYVLFWIVVVIVAIALFLAFMSQKRLPKKMIMANDGKFSVNGEKVPSEVTCRATGCKKKYGSLTVNSPEYSRNPMAVCSFSLELEAVDNLWTKTADRRAAVKKVRVGDMSQVRFVEIDGTRLTPDKVLNELVVRGSTVEESYPIIISSNSTFAMATEVTGFGFGGDVSCKMSGEFEFH